MRQRPQIPGMAAGGGPGLPASALRGVVDLGALAAKPQAAPAATAQGPGAGTGGEGSGPAGGGTDAIASPLVFDTSDATFDTDVIERSLTVPVVIDFWAEWCGPCKQLSPLLERLTVEYGGRFVLAKLDVDANPALAQEFGIQSIPMVMAVVGGRLVPLFPGAVPEAQVRRYLEELLRLAAENGVTGTADGQAPEELPEPPMDPALAAAYTALEENDLDGAAQAFRNVLNANPGDTEAKLALAQVELMLNTRDLDVDQVRADAEAKPDDAAAQIAAAELDLSTGRVDEAIDRLVGFVARSAGADRDAARVKLLDFFELLGPEDPRTATGRQKLTRVLF
ncbi:thioredoxin domain protein [Catenulispora acidiphila DSM 44928]|uniref:Thioredoxin domain protein n=1 Tax=Catenulispora acidiphila (strain DSM 44928 / JCM 14897 / NBRC 102108 / NRRL B-24433 / ID139908) TaxID=479433 RepID=C7Q7B3_CATAD|nr:tetratricopeptide repeat protein [Catenulispora acidiphila]ACU70201.1 thioredoxin domain protein [Catenulispora acidiphila DSM 44928]